MNKLLFLGCAVTSFSLFCICHVCAKSSKPDHDDWIYLVWHRGRNIWGAFTVAALIGMIASG